MIFVVNYLCQKRSAMKNIILFVSVISLIWACSSQQDISSSDQSNIEINSDSTEYELIVFDARFETFLVSQPYPSWYYSNEYYKQWNIRYCIEWNIRHSDPLRFGDFYETNIPYDSSVDYGLDFNFRLYQYFQFIEKEYGIVLISRKGNT